MENPNLNENLKLLLLRPNPPPKGKYKKKLPVQRPDKETEVELPQLEYVYICDPSAVDTLEEAPEDSLKGLWARKRSADESLSMCSSSLLQNKRINFKWKWKEWKPFENGDLATTTLIDMVLRMTGSTFEVSKDRSLYESVVALLQAHSANEVPGGLRRFVTSNVRLWELFYSTSEKQDLVRWAILTAGGGRQVVPVGRLWDLDGGKEHLQDQGIIEWGQWGIGCSGDVGSSKGGIKSFQGGEALIPDALGAHSRVVIYDILEDVTTYKILEDATTYEILEDVTTAGRCSTSDAINERRCLPALEAPVRARSTPLNKVDALYDAEFTRLERELKVNKRMASLRTNLGPNPSSEPEYQSEKAKVADKVSEPHEV